MKAFLNPSRVKYQGEFVVLKQFTRERLSFGNGQRRREQRVDCYFERVLDHVGDDSGQQRAGQLEARVVIDLNEPSAELIIDHEVQSEDLKRKLSIFAVQDAISGCQRVLGKLHHLRVDCLEKIELLVRVVIVKILLKLSKRYFVPILILAIIL